MTLSKSQENDLKAARDLALNNGIIIKLIHGPVPIQRNVDKSTGLEFLLINLGEAKDDFGIVDLSKLMALINFKLALVLKERQSVELIETLNSLFSQPLTS